MREIIPKTYKCHYFHYVNYYGDRHPSDTTKNFVSAGFKYGRRETDDAEYI